MFDISEKLIVEQSDEIFGVSQISWDDSSWKQLCLVSDEEVISLSNVKVYVFFRFCVMSWKGESEPNIKYCLGGKFELVQRFTTIQNFGHNWRRADRIRADYFPRIHHIAARRQSPRAHDNNGRPITIQRTNHIHVDVQWHHMGIWRLGTGMQC